MVKSLVKLYRKIHKRKITEIITRLVAVECLIHLNGPSQCWAVNYFSIIDCCQGKCFFASDSLLSFPGEVLCHYISISLNVFSIRYLSRWVEEVCVPSSSYFQLCVWSRTRWNMLYDTTLDIKEMHHNHPLYSSGCSDHIILFIFHNINHTN